MVHKQGQGGLGHYILPRLKSKAVASAFAEGLVLLGCLAHTHQIKLCGGFKAQKVGRAVLNRI